MGHIYNTNRIDVSSPQRNCHRYSFRTVEDANNKILKNNIEREEDRQVKKY